MKSSKIAVFAILLWLITLAVFAWFFVRGNTATGSDNRTAVILGAGERDLILTEMRGLLTGVHDILEGINHGDMKQVGQAAHAVGMSAAADVNPALMAKLPMPFKQLGMSVHRDMDELGKAAETGKTAPELLNMLTATLSKCVGCHAAWQLNTGN